MYNAPWNNTVESKITNTNAKHMNSLCLNHCHIHTFRHTAPNCNKWTAKRTICDGWINDGLTLFGPCQRLSSFCIKFRGFRWIFGFFFEWCSLLLLLVPLSVVLCACVYVCCCRQSISFLVRNFVLFVRRL